jgi:hypothetical protein
MKLPWIRERSRGGLHTLRCDGAQAGLRGGFVLGAVWGFIPGFPR